MEIKEKLNNIYKKSPSSIKGLIASDAITWSSPDEFFYRIKKAPYEKQTYIFRYKSFKFLSDHRETFSAELSKYNNGIAPNSHQTVWKAFCTAATEIEKEVGSEF